MLNLKLYIHGAGSIAPAADDQPETITKRLAAEPDYTAWIPPMQLRRTSKVVRMGIGAAKLCLAAAGLERPDALSVGTAMGCLQDTEFFLSKMVSQEEKMLTPTSFIQSTHNTVGGQIALLTGCHGHNMTYVHRGHSFEHALINAKLYLNDHPGETILTGGIDELTNSSYVLMRRAGFYRKRPGQDSADEAIIAGEGAAFFAVNEEPAGALLQLVSLHLFVAQQAADAVAEVMKFLSAQNITSGQVDVLMTGDNGEAEPTVFYETIRKEMNAQEQISFKRSSGEYATASACALAQLTQEQGGKTNTEEKKIILINHYCDHYSCWYLKA